jgi:carbon-monoxide dehydrogenase large subunit
LPAVWTWKRAAGDADPRDSDNVCFKREHDTGGVDEAFAQADAVVEDTFHFGRHTGVCLEGRAILADYNAGEHSLTVYHATQAPHMMQDIFSRHLGIPEANVRVICKDVGGSFGIKVHVYADEMATAAISVMLRRPVKFIADRLESFLTDIHAREHKAKVRLACTKSGDILAFDLDDLTAIGPYSVYPRTSGIEGNQVVNLTGGPYHRPTARAEGGVPTRTSPASTGRSGTRSRWPSPRASSTSPRRSSAWIPSNSGAGTSSPTTPTRTRFLRASSSRSSRTTSASTSFWT